MINRNPMTFKPQQYRPQPPRLPPYINRTVIPTKEIDPLIISTLLLKVSTDDINILELGNFILSNGITTNDMINEDGESILHLIISNQNLSDKKKLEIIKYLGANFNLLLSYDKNGRTPLHIAVQNQLYDIANELINAGHDVNAVDNGYKTPLHYAVIGKNIDAPSKIDKTLIPDKKIKIKSDLIKNITDNVVKFMQNTPEINMFFANQYATLNNSKYVFQQEIYDKMNSSDVYNQMIQILQNSQLPSEQQQKKIFEISADVNTSVRTLLSTKLDLAKKEIKLENNMENGWGPSQSITDKIMPYEKYEELKESFTVKKETLKQDLKEKLSRELDVLKDNLKTMSIDIEEIENFTRKLIFSHTFYETLTKIIDPVGDYIFNDINELEINQNIIDQFLYNNIPQTIYSPLLNQKTNYNLITNQYSSDDGATQNPFDLSYSSFITDSTHYFKDSDKDKNEINNLLYDYDEDQLLSKSQPDNMGGFTLPTDDINTIKRKLYHKSNGSMSYYNTTCMNIYFKPLFLEEIQNNLITKISNTVMTNMDNFDVNILFDVNNIVLSILNCTNTLPKLIKEYDNLILYLNKLKSNLGSIPQNNNKIINGNQYNLTILHYHLHHEIDRLIKQFEKNKSELQTKFFNTFRNLYLYVNQIIEYVNLNHSIQYITMYFNNFTDAIATQTTTELIQNIFYGIINKFPEYFKSYEEITGMLSPNNDKSSEQTNKRKLVEKFLYQFNRFNLNKYIGDRTTVDSDGINGYLKTDTTNNNISNLDIVLADLKIKYDEQTDNDNYKYNKGVDATKFGLIQLATGKQFDKKDMSFPIIAPFIGEFYMIQKYIIIRVLIQKLFDIFNGTTGITPRILDLKESINKLQKDIEDNIKPNPEDHSILLISLAKIIDKIYNANLENIINITTNNYGYRYVRETTNPKDYKIINITELNKINISELNFDDLKKSILKIFKRNKTSKFFNYAEDILVKKIKDSNIYKITGDVIGNVPNELYYKYNKNILELLLEKGSSLNNKDKDGNTPLILALLQNNDSAIKYILEDQQFQNISVYNKASRNRFGAKPYDICAKSLKVVIDNFDNEISNKNLELLTKEVNDKISSLTKINHNMRFSNIIFRMLVYLLNHDLYSMLNSYKFQKDESFHQYFFTKITSQIKKLPLLENIDSLIGSYYSVIDDVLKEDKRKLLKENEQKTNLDKEEDLLEEELNSKPNKFRKREISLLKSQKLLKIGEFTRGNKSPRLRYKEYNIDMDDIESNLDSNIKFLQKIKSKNILSSTDILTMYGDLHNVIVKLNVDDYRTYPALWENLFNLQDSTKKTDDTQIINKILEKLKNVIAMKDIKKLDKEMIKMISLSINLLKQHINDYFELPLVYAGDNYVLDRIIDIYEHILKNTMLVNLYHIIEKLVRLELIDKLPISSNERKYYKDLDDDVEKIMDTTVLNLSIQKYIFEIIPKKILKVSLQIYENEDDEDRNTNLMNIFDFINKLLEANTQISIKSDSKIIKTLNTYVYSYFKEYLDANIKMMKKITDGYFSMIISLAPKLEIFDIIIKKAISEK